MGRACTAGGKPRIQALPDLLTNAMPADVLSKQQVRATGRKHLTNGAILLAVGLMITVGLALLFPGLVILAFGLLIGGLFYFLYGLLVCLLRRE